MWRSLSGILVAMLLSVCLAAIAQEGPAYQETISVVRYIVEARVTDGKGDAVRGLTASDFEVTVAGRRAEVESVTWTGNDTELPVPPPEQETDQETEAEPTATVTPTARLVVVFVGVDFARNSERIKGQMQFNVNLLDAIFDAIGDQQRVAVLSFDSHLKVHCDFTTDLEKAKEATLRTIEIRKLPMPEPAETGPSIVRHLDHHAMKYAANAEEALLLIAGALREIEGPKVMIMPSWGMGQPSVLRNGGVSLKREWSEAVALLRRDNVPVMSVNTGGGGQLGLGLLLTSHATGGVYVSAISAFSHQFRGIEGFLAGYYELTLRLDEPLEAGEYPVSIRTRDKTLFVRGASIVLVEPSDVLWGEAVKLFNSRETEVALAVLRESIASESVTTVVMVERLRALTGAGQWEGALVVVEELERRGAVDADVAEMEARSREGMQENRQSEAIGRLTEARRRLLAGETQGVEMLLDEAIVLEPELAEAWYERGMLRLSEGEAESATGDLRRYLELEPRGAHASEARAVVERLGP